MFNKTHNTYVDNSTDFPDEIQVTHNYAPTSEQIKLLREMEKDLRNDILEHVRIDGNDFKFNCFLNIKDFDDFQLIAVFTLNQKKCKVEHQFCRFTNKEQSIKDFFQKIAECIVREFIMSDYQTIKKLTDGIK